MSYFLSAVKGFVNKFSFENNARLNPPISALETRTEEVAISRLSSHNSSSESAISSPFFSYTGREEGAVVINPIYQEDEECEENKDSAVDKNNPSPSSQLSDIADSPTLSLRDRIDEEVFGTMIIGSLVVKENAADEESKPAFLLHANALTSDHEWENILVAEEERILKESDDDLFERIFGNPSEYKQCTIRDDVIVEEVIEEISDSTYSTDIKIVQAASRCGVFLGHLQSRMPAFS